MHSDVNCLQHVGIPFISKTIGVSFLSSGALFCRARKMHVQSSRSFYYKGWEGIYFLTNCILYRAGVWIRSPIMTGSLSGVAVPGALLFSVLGWLPRAPSRGSVGRGAWSVELWEENSQDPPLLGSLPSRSHPPGHCPTPAPAHRLFLSGFPRLSVSPIGPPRH